MSLTCFGVNLAEITSFEILLRCVMRSISGCAMLLDSNE